MDPKGPIRAPLGFDPGDSSLLGKPLSLELASHPLVVLIELALCFPLVFLGRVWV